MMIINDDNMIISEVGEYYCKYDVDDRIVIDNAYRI